MRIIAEMATTNNSKMELLPELFTLITPRMAMRGRQKKSATKGDGVRDAPIMLRVSLFNTQYIAYNASTRVFKVINEGRVDRGSEMPRRGYTSFINNPVNIKNAILNPTENNRVSVLLKSRSPKTPIIIIPGTNVR